jgi:hypothetical protein
MLRRGLVVLILTLPCHFTAQPQSPWYGTWRLVPETSAYKKVTTRIEPKEDGLRVTYEMVGLRGGVTHWEWSGRFDGNDYPVQGVENVLTNAYRKIDDRSYEIVIKVEGTITAVARVVAASDGKTLNVTTEEKLSNGQTRKTVVVYERVS